MEALFIVINHEEHFQELLTEFAKEGIRGGTIFETEGLAATQAASHSTSGLDMEYFRLFLNEGRPYNKTILLLLKEEQVQVAKQCVHRIVGSLDRENVGIMFSFNVTGFEGLTK
ncbi:hypothetical protein [Allofustis seminis]|uniref:hypothetical protein n=1 Tax=Allofustis seminis TaxID=166939 RepID=UPI00037C3C7F|nr:hypothetical protein [Allofustis seminis]